MHDINLCLMMHFYIDAFDHDADMTIIQFQNFVMIDTTNANNRTIEIFIVYDSFTFAFIKRKYLIYKRELYVMIIFVIKYNYLCKHSYLFVVVHTNHRSLTHFLDSNLHEDIYDH